MIGVPQGLILGPLLFILFTKSLEEVVTAHDIQFHSYADDTQMYLNFQPVNECDNQFYLTKLESCLKSVNIWMKHHFLKLNIDKTDVMEVSLYTKLRPIWLIFNSNLLDHDIELIFDTVTQVRNLGTRSWYWTDFWHCDTS